MFHGSSEEGNSHFVPKYFAQQISPEDFKKQKKVYTAAAVSELVRSKEYQEWYQRCSSCGASWYYGQFSSQCQECGGFTMVRPCAICDGHCSATWHRDVDMSHRMKEGHWNGKCLLPESAQTHFFLQKFVDNSEDTLCEALSDLGKS